MKILQRILDKVCKPTTAYAHCDIPCGVYEVDTMKHAVETIEAMTTKMLEQKHPECGNPDEKNYHDTLSRMVATKEEWAQRCKQELLILWTDHFKPEHLEKWPDLHDKIWKAAKLCSEVKREVNPEKVQQLKTAVDGIAEIFAASKR